jgi:NAD(P)H-dependent FMN reductase
MKVLTICGSLRADSSTARALEIASTSARTAGAEVNAIHLGELTLPFCDGRSDEASYGGDVVTFIDMVRASDGLIIGSPNYHGSVAGVLKNALDLLGPDAIRDKLVGLIATARGDAGAMNTLNHMRHICRWMNGWVLPAEVSIPRAQTVVGEDVDETIRVQLVSLGQELVRYHGLLRG